MSDRPRMTRLGATMSDRERETLILLTRGCDVAEIADTLGVTANYVYTLIRLLRARFDAKTNAGIVVRAVEEGIVKIDGTWGANQ